MERHLNCFDTVCFRCMQDDGNALQVLHILVQRCSKSVSNCTNGQAHWGVLDAVDCRSVGEEMDSLFVQYFEKMNYELQLIELLTWKHQQAKNLDNEPHPHYFIVYSRSDSVWFVDCREFCTCNCDF